MSIDVIQTKEGAWVDPAALRVLRVAATPWLELMACPLVYQDFD